MICPRCGWHNTWIDSGDRGAAQHYHDISECPNPAPLTTPSTQEV